MSLLLKGGILLLHDEKLGVHPEKKDLLVQEDRIARIEESIAVDEASEVIDCAGKIVSPGFIDTHHHVWQTPLKAQHGNETLLEYLYTGNFANSLFDPTDIFWGQLSGALECIDAGTTTVVDHATLNYSPEHSKEAIRATISSGVRSTFCYCPTPRVATWQPEFKLEADITPEWVMSTLEELAALPMIGPNGRVRLGFAFDGLYMPAEALKSLFARVRAAGVKLITLHVVHGSMFGKDASSAAKILSPHGLLDSDILLSHYNNIDKDEVNLLRKANAHISCTPSTELQMGHGNPVSLRPELHEHSSLGVDCHSNNSSSIPTQMMLLLQWARARRHEDFEAKGKWAKDVLFKVEEVFNLGTIFGARAIGQEDQLGSLKVGKKADIVVFDGMSPGMLGAIDRDPVVAVVLHSSIRDVDTVIVDGVVRKSEGRLRDCKVPATFDSTQEGEGNSVTWKEVASEVMRISQTIEERKTKTVDLAIAREGLIKAFYLNVDGLADSL